MDTLERVAREASAALNMLLVQGNAKMWPDDERALKHAISVADRIACAK